MMFVPEPNRKLRKGKADSPLDIENVVRPLAALSPMFLDYVGYEVHQGENHGARF